MKKLIYFLLISGLLCACTHSEETVKNTAYLLPVSDSSGDMQLLLNTEIKLLTVEKDSAADMYDSLNETVTHYHILFDGRHYYDEEGETINNLRSINDSYGSEEKISVDNDLLDALKESFTLSKITEGYFNPTVGKLSDIWKRKFDEGELYNSDPSEEEIEDACNCIIPYDELEDYIEIDENAMTVTFHRYERCEDRVVIDLGGFAKGYVLDRAAEILESYGSPFLIDGGSSSIIAYSPEDSSVDWTIGIRSPLSGNVLYALKERNISLSTSGDDERFFLLKEEDKIVRRHHILDPYSGYSQNYYRGITLFSEDNAAVLDALSTAFFSIEDIDTQNRILSAVREHYGIKVYRCILKEEGNGLKMMVDSEIENSFLDDVLSEDLRRKEVIE